MDRPIVIIGSGHAGSELSMGLRKRGHEGRIVLVGDEAHLPYHRPPLSKGFLLGKTAQPQLYFRPQEIYEQSRIELRSRTRVLSIDRNANAIVLADGERLAYDKLVLATGSRPRKLSVPSIDGAEPQNLLVLRTLADAEILRAQLLPKKRLVVIGGGYIGLEVAAAAAQLGLKVTVIEALPRLLSRVTGAEVANFVEKQHCTHGVEFKLSTTVRDLELDDTRTHVRAVLTQSDAGSERIEADVVLVGIGIVPNTELASAASLSVENGILVDHETRTSDAAIFAIGDCANQPSTYAQGRLRLESVPNALESARIASAVLLGQLAPSTSAPWFWSEQYGFRLQMVGLSAGHDRCITRSSEDGKELSAFYLKSGRIIAADVIGKPTDFGTAKRLVEKQAEIDPAELADPRVSLAAHTS